MIRFITINNREKSQKMNYETFKNCQILSVYKRLPDIYKDYEIHIGTDGMKVFTVKITCHNLKEELLKVLNGDTERIYLAHGMSDVDVYKKGKDFCIEWSPIETVYQDFIFTKSKFTELIETLE